MAPQVESSYEVFYSLRYSFVSCGTLEWNDLNQKTSPIFCHAGRAESGKSPHSYGQEEQTEPRGLLGTGMQ